MSENTGKDAGNVSITGISRDKFLVFVTKLMVVFVTLLNNVINSGPGVKTSYELSVTQITSNAFKTSIPEAVKRIGTVWAVL